MTNEIRLCIVVIVLVLLLMAAVGAAVCYWSSARHWRSRYELLSRSLPGLLGPRDVRRIWS